MLSNAWTRSSRCNADQPSCVEVAIERDGAQSPLEVQIRDSKDGGLGASLHYSPAEWRAFVEGVKAGEFDLA